MYPGCVLRGHQVNGLTVDVIVIAALLRVFMAVWFSISPDRIWLDELIRFHRFAAARNWGLGDRYLITQREGEKG